MKFKLDNRIANKYEMFCKFYNINNKKIVKTILFEYGYMIVTCNIQQTTETEFHSTYTIQVGQSLDNLVSLDEYLKSNGNHEALQMWKSFLNYTGLQIQ